MSSKNRAKKYRYVKKMRENMLQTVDGNFQNPLLSDSSNKSWILIKSKDRILCAVFNCYSICLQVLLEGDFLQLPIKK